MSAQVPTAEARRAATQAERWGCRLAGYTAGAGTPLPATVTVGPASFGRGRRSVIAALPPEGSPEDLLALAARFPSRGVTLVTVRDAASAAALSGALPLAVGAEADAAASLPALAETAQAIVVTAEHMHDYGLLRAVGATPLPVVLYRSRAATIQEWLLAAEYVLRERPGRRDVILCEGGIRTFEPYTRYTLDVGAIAAVRELSPLPVIADPGAAAGRPELVAPLGPGGPGRGARDGVVLHARLPGGQAPPGAPAALEPDDLAQLADELLGLSAARTRSSRRPAG